MTRAEPTLDATGPDQHPTRPESLADCIRNGTYWGSLKTSAHLAGWRAARTSGLWDAKQSDAVADAVLELVRERLLDWEEFHHLRTVHGVEPAEGSESRAEQHRVLHAEDAPAPPGTVPWRTPEDA